MFSTIKNTIYSLSANNLKFNKLPFPRQEEVESQSKESIFISDLKHTENKGVAKLNYTNSVFAEKHIELEGLISYSVHRNNCFQNKFCEESFMIDLQVANAAIEHPVIAYTLMPIRPSLQSFNRIRVYQDRFDCNQILISNQASRNGIFYPHYCLNSKNYLESIKDLSSKKFSDGSVIQAKTSFFLKTFLDELGFSVFYPEKRGTRSDICLSNGRDVVNVDIKFCGLNISYTALSQNRFEYFRFFNSNESSHIIISEKYINLLASSLSNPPYLENHNLIFSFAYFPNRKELSQYKLLFDWLNYEILPELKSQYAHIPSDCKVYPCFLGIPAKEFNKEHIDEVTLMNLSILKDKFSLSESVILSFLNSISKV